MFKSKYSTVLTVILIILIIAIIIIATMLSVNAYKDYQDEKDRKKVYATIQEDIYKEDIEEEEEKSQDTTINNEIIPIQPVENTTVQNTTTQNNTTSRPTTKFYKEYPMIGYINIPKTNVQYPILLDVSEDALETAVGVEYPSNPTLNEPGNVVIIGHNYRNGKFFANNKKLVIGDKIQITDLKGTTLTYTIYEIMTIPDTDSEYVTRDRGDNIEISLSTCTDDGKAVLVILARVE